MKIIFLDFDGVLLPQSVHFPLLKQPGRRAMAHPDCIAVLNEIIARSGARIVVSSSWRSDDGKIGDMKHLLRHWGCVGEVVGVTPRLERFVNGIFNAVERGHEIQAWLDKSTGVESFAIIDDDPDMAHLMDRLIQTTFAEGLTHEHIGPTLRLLETPR